MAEQQDETPQRRTSDASIARLDERVAGLGTLVKEFREDMCQRLSKVETSLADGYVTRAEYGPLRTLVFGGVAILLTAVVGALVKLVVLK